MMSLAIIRKLRSNPHLLFVRLPYFLSFLCIVIGVIWLLLLPLDEYSRQTYISENALLPGQVHTYFTGSEQNIFRGYKKELEGLLNIEEGQSAEIAPVYVLFFFLFSYRWIVFGLWFFFPYLC